MCFSDSSLLSQISAIRYIYISPCAFLLVESLVDSMPYGRLHLSYGLHFHCLSVLSLRQQGVQTAIHLRNPRIHWLMKR